MSQVRAVFQSWLQAGERGTQSLIEQHSIAVKLSELGLDVDTFCVRFHEIEKLPAYIDDLDWDSVFRVCLNPERNP